MGEIYKPPRRVINNSKIKVFLAGTIEMGDSIDWQTEVAKSFKDLDINIINPRRDDFDPSWKQEYENENFYKQVSWELTNLDNADYILFNFLPESKSPVTMLELGLYADSGKCIVCCPKEFWRRGNIEIVCDKYGIPLFDSLEYSIISIKNKLLK